MRSHRLQTNCKRKLSNPFRLGFFFVSVFSFTYCLLSSNPFVTARGNSPPKQKSTRSKSMFGNIVRIMKYDRASNVANAIPALNFQGMVLNWHRLDDGVMGGQSETLHSSTITLSDGSKLEGLHFTGTINTKGGGFTSIRAPLEESAYLPKEAVAIKLKIRGDGKMYKILLSDGSGGFRGGLSFQADFPTKALADDDASQEITLPLESFIPSFGGSTISKEKADFKAEKMRQIGLMLSLKLSDGSANPKESFGEGIFPFSLIVESLEIVLEGNEKKTG